MNTKYKFTGEIKKWNGVTLNRIEALKDFGGVSKGEKGGYVESEKNLSVSGDAWVYGNAWVYGDARVSGDAWVYGNARVYGDARVSGDARVYGDARVSGELKLEAGLFFGVKWSGEKVQEVEIENGNYLIYKGDAKFGEDEPEIEEMTEEQICKALGKTIKIIK